MILDPHRGKEVSNFRELDIVQFWEYLRYSKENVKPPKKIMKARTTCTPGNHLTRQAWKWASLIICDKSCILLYRSSEELL
ncbi:hypothetical protein WAI453_009884 [Rhynchosporium graminicola]